MMYFFGAVARGYEDSRFFRKQVMPEHQLAVELERRRLAELQFMRKPVANHHFYGPTYDNFKVPEGLQTASLQLF